MKSPENDQFLLWDVNRRLKVGELKVLEKGTPHATIPTHIIKTSLPEGSYIKREAVYSEVFGKNLETDLIDPGYKYRVVNDYKEINAFLMDELLPVHNLNTIIQVLQKYNFPVLTQLDVKNAFNTVPLLNPLENTVCIEVEGKKIYSTVMEFGNAQAPGHYCHVVDILRGKMNEAVPDGIFLFYFDNILIASRAVEDHGRMVKGAIEVCTNSGVLLNHSKNLIACTSMPLLGYKWTNHGFFADPAKLKQIADFPVPKTAKQIMKLGGMVGWSRQFIPNAAVPLQELFELIKETRSDKKSINSPMNANQLKQTKNFTQEIKAALSQTVGIGLIDVEHNAAGLHVDASQKGFGAALVAYKQGGEPKDGKVIGLYSKKFEDTWTKRKNVDRELAAILSSVQHFIDFLRHFKYRYVFSDCTSAISRNSSTLTSQELTYRKVLQDNNIQLKHIAGRDNVIADLLSRLVDKVQICHNPVRAKHEAECYNIEVLRQELDSTTDLGTTITPHDLTWDSESDLDDGDEFGYTKEGSTETINPVNLFHISAEISLLQEQDVIMNNLEVPQISDDSYNRLYSAYRYQLLYGEKDEQNDILSKQVYINNIETLKKNLHENLKKGEYEALSDEHKLKYRLQLREFAKNAHLIDHCGWSMLSIRLGMLSPYGQLNAEIAQEVVSGCNICVTRSPHRKEYDLKTSYKADTPFKFLTMDIAGPITESAHGNKYILLISDVYTYFTWTFPLKDKTSSTINACLRLLFSWIGVPRTLQCDNAGEFNSLEQKKMFAKLQIQHRTSSAYDAAANGFIEAMVKKIKVILERIVASKLEAGGDITNWDAELARANFLANATPIKDVGFSPYYLSFGFEPDLQLYNELEAETFSQEGIIRDKESFLQIKALIHERLSKLREYRIKNLNKQLGAKDSPLQDGSLVLITNPTKTFGEPNYLGPFTIAGFDGHAYSLKDADGKLCKRKAPREFIKLLNNQDTGKDQDGFVQVARIMGKDTRIRNKPKYLVEFETGVTQWVTAYDMNPWLINEYNWYLEKHKANNKKNKSNAVFPPFIVKDAVEAAKIRNTTD